MQVDTELIHNELNRIAEEEKKMKNPSKKRTNPWSNITTIKIGTTNLKPNKTKEEKKKAKEIYKYWNDRAKKSGKNHTTSWNDINIMKMEANNIRNHINNGDKVLDIGCSNGFTTAIIHKGKNIKLTGFDYSHEAIKQAQKRKLKNVRFYVGDALNIKEEFVSFFDKVYTIRVLINLPSWELQKMAILEVHKVLKKRGLYLLSEAFLGSLEKLNALRKIANMKELTQPLMNLYLREDLLKSFVKDYFKIVEIKKFSSIYYVASRFLRCLTMEKGEENTYLNKINNFFVKFKETANSGDFGIQKLYVLKKL